MKRLRRRQYDPVIIERTIGLVLGPFTVLYRSFLKNRLKNLQNFKRNFEHTDKSKKKLQDDHIFYRTTPSSCLTCLQLRMMNMNMMGALHLAVLSLWSNTTSYQSHHTPQQNSSENIYYNKLSTQMSHIKCVMNLYWTII